MIDDDEHVPLDSYAQGNDCFAILNFKVSGEQNQEKQFPYESERRTCWRRPSRRWRPCFLLPGDFFTKLCRGLGRRML